MKVKENSTFKPPLLACDNLYLRHAKYSDFESIKNYRQDTENCRYIRPPEDDDTTMTFVEQMANPWRLTEGVWNGLVICLTGDDTVVGEVAFNIESWEHQRVEIGYRISESVAGKGVCTRATQLLINCLVNDIGCHKLVAKCDTRNKASYRVMEKLGFVREALFKEHYLLGDEWTDQYDYGLLAKDWRS